MKKIWILVIVAAALFALWVATMYIDLAMDEHEVEVVLSQLENAEGDPACDKGEQCAGWENYGRLVDEYNLSLEKFPGSVFAPMFGFHRIEPEAAPDTPVISPE